MTEKEFTTEWIKKIKKDLKRFPEDFISIDNVEILEMPAKNLLLTPQLFDSYEIIDNDSNIIFHLNDINKAKYILYSNRNKPKNIPVPLKQDDIEKAVQLYETYIDEILRAIEKDYRTKFPASKNFSIISIHIFNALNLVRL